MVETVTIIVEGLVQGVYYRQSTRAKAVELSITGEVKNRTDGTVHIIATGDSSQLDALVEWCRVGPENAIVTKLTVEKIPLQLFSGFTIVRRV